MAVGCGDDLVASGNDEVGDGSSDTASPDESETETETETETGTESETEGETDTGPELPVPGELRWHLELPGTARCLAAWDGGLLVGGSFAQTLIVPNGTFEAVTEDGMLLQVDYGGEVVWGQGYGGEAADRFDGLTVAGERVVAAASYAYGTTSYGGEVLPPATDLFGRNLALVGLRAPAPGEALVHDWSLGFDGLFAFRHLAMTGDGRVSYAGRLESGLAFEGFELPPPAHGVGINIRTKLDGSEPPQASVSEVLSYGEAVELGIASFTIFAEDPGGAGLYLTGVYEGSIDLGGEGLSAEDWGNFLARFDAEGELEWVRSLGGAFVSDGELSPEGDLLLVGGFLGAFEFGAEVLSAGTGSFDGYVLRVTPSGDASLELMVTGPNVESIEHLALAPNGDLGVSGWGKVGIDLGAGVVPADHGNYDAFIARYDGDGELLWGHVLGSTSADSVEGSEFGADGHLYTLLRAPKPLDLDPEGGGAVVEGAVLLSHE